MPINFDRNVGSGANVYAEGLASHFWCPCDSEGHSSSFGAEVDGTCASMYDCYLYEGYGGGRAAVC